MIRTYRIPTEHSLLEQNKVDDVSRVEIDTDSIDWKTFVEGDIMKVQLYAMTSGEMIVSGPRIGIKKKIIVVNNQYGPGRDKKVNDPMVLINPEIIEVSKMVNSPSIAPRLNSLTLRYTCRQGNYVTQTFTSHVMIEKLLKALKEIGEDKVHEFIDGTANSN